MNTGQTPGQEMILEEATESCTDDRCTGEASAVKRSLKRAEDNADVDNEFPVPDVS